MSKPQRAPRGFTLIELMVSVAIIGALMSIAMPEYTSFRCRAAQASGKSTLMSLVALQHSYFAENGEYGWLEPLGPAHNEGLHNPLGFVLSQYQKAAYIYGSADTGPGFVTTMFARDGLTNGDVWEVAHDADGGHGPLRQTMAGCL